MMQSADPVIAVPGTRAFLAPATSFTLTYFAGAPDDREARGQLRVGPSVTLKAGARSGIAALYAFGEHTSYGGVAPLSVTRLGLGAGAEITRGILWLSIAADTGLALASAGRHTIYGLGGKVTADLGFHVARFLTIGPNLSANLDVFLAENTGPWIPAIGGSVGARLSFHQ